MKNTLNSLVLTLRASVSGPPTHETSFAFTKKWNQIVVLFLGRAPRPTEKGCRLSDEEEVAHAVACTTERLFISYLMRLAGRVGPDDAATRLDLNDMQLQAVTRWLRMGQDCGSDFCSEMREQERRWQVVDWLHEYSNDIWMKVEKRLPEAVRARVKWRGETL